MLLQTCMKDWEIFTKAMGNIFRNILSFQFRDQHSVKSMFNPLPYCNTDHYKVLAVCVCVCGCKLTQ